MDRPRSVEKVVDEKFKKLQEEKTEWVNMGSDVHQVRIGLDHVVDTDNLAAQLLPLDDQTAFLLDLGALLKKIIPQTIKPSSQALPTENYLSTCTQS